MAVLINNMVMEYANQQRLKADLIIYVSIMNHGLVQTCQLIDTLR